MCVLCKLLIVKNEIQICFREQVVAGNLHPHFLLYIIHAERLDFNLKLERFFDWIGLLFHFIRTFSNQPILPASGVIKRTQTLAVSAFDDTFNIGFFGNFI